MVHLLLIATLAGAAGVGALIHKYGLAAVEAGAKKDLATAVADVKAELAKASTDLTALKTKVQTLLSKIGL